MIHAYGAGVKGGIDAAKALGKAWLAEKKKATHWERNAKPSEKKKSHTQA